jgi:hypothetical protein
LLASIAIATSAYAASGSKKSGRLVKYSYVGPPMTVFTGAKPPWNEESRVTGWFIAEEIPPSTTVDYLDPDIDWPFINLPKQFYFTDGARSITPEQLEAPVKDTGNRLDRRIHEVRTFNFMTDDNGDIVAWDILFVHDVRRSTFLTAHNGGIYGQDLVEVDATHYGCVATEKCTANANYTSQGPIFDSWFDDLQRPGKWTKEYVDQ